MSDPSDPQNISKPFNRNDILDGMGSVAGTPSEGDWSTNSESVKQISDGLADASAITPDDVVRPQFAIQEAERYLKGAVLGVGGMGRVWSVQDKRLRRVVALKELSPAVAGFVEMRERLAREAWITAQLEHPGIVPVYDAGQGADGALYYVMRLIRGRSLHAVIEATPSLAKRLVLLRHFRDASEAIAYAHSMGIVHRDLKPQNIMIGEFGETQVVDWGLARPIVEVEGRALEGVLEGEARGSVAIEHPSMTQAGEIVGTPHFMSPEQARGLSVTERSDIWSLGAVLYVLLTRSTPLQGDSQALLAALREQPSIVSVLSREPAAPPELAKIVERALQIEPYNRYPSAQALVEDISAWLEGRRVGAYDYSRWELLKRFARAWRVPLIISTIAIFLLGLMGAVSYLQVVDEQTRTAHAEQKTRESLTLADQHLASALIEQALTIAPLGARPEAETLAAHALMLQESPEARGILAQFSASDRFQLIEHIDLPPCIARSLSSQGLALLCIEEGALSLWNLHPFALRWRRPLSVLHASMLDEMGRVFVQFSPITDAALDATNGAVLAEYARVEMPKGFSLFSRYAAVLGQTKRTLIYDGLTGERLERTICTSDLFEAAVAVDPSQETLAVFCNDTQTLHLGPLRGAAMTATTLPHDGGLSTLQFSSNGALLVGGNTRGNVFLIQTSNQKVIRHIHAGVGVISHLAFLNHDRQILIAGEKEGAMLWDISSGTQIGRLPRWAGSNFSVSNDEQSITTLGQNIQRWYLPDHTPPHLFISDKNPQIGLASASLSPDEQWLVGNRGDGSISIFSVNDGARVDLPTGFHSPIKSGTFSLDGERYYPISSIDSIPAVDTKTWQPIPFLVSPPGRLIEMLHANQLVRLGYTASLSYVEYTPHNQNAEPNQTHKHSIAFTNSLLDIGANHTKTFAAILEEHAPQRILRFATGHPPTIEPFFEVTRANAVDISSDGQMFALAKSQELMILEANAPLLSPSDLQSATKLQFKTPSPILDVAFSPDDLRVAASDAEGNLWLWSTTSGHLLAILRGHTLRVPWLQFNATGDTIFSASWDGTLRRWNVQHVETPPAQVLQDITQAWGLSLKDAIRRTSP